MSDFDTSHPFDEGLDPTSVWGSYASSLLQLVREARPSTPYGMVVVSKDTPPTTGIKEWHKRSIWIVPPTAPATKWNGYFYNSDAGSWDNLDKLLNNILADGSVTLAKLDPTQGSALQILRKNAANNGYELVDPANVITTGTIAKEKLTPDSIANRTILVSYNGTWVWFTFDDLMLELMGSNVQVTVVNLSSSKAAGGTASNYQVISYDGTAGDGLKIDWRYIEDLLRNGQLPTRKLAIPSGKQGLQPQVDADGTDFIYVTPNTGIVHKYALLYDQQNVGVDGSAFAGTGPHTIVINTEKYDPDAIVTISGSRFIPISGKYRATAVVPIRHQNNDSGNTHRQSKLMLANMNTGAIISCVSVSQGDDELVQAWTVDGFFTANGTDEYAILLKGHSTLDVQIGINANVDAEEVYTQLTLHRYAN